MCSFLIRQQSARLEPAVGGSMGVMGILQQLFRFGSEQNCRSLAPSLSLQPKWPSAMALLLFRASFAPATFGTPQ